MDGECWRIPSGIDERREQTLKDWSYEDPDKEEPYGKCMLTMIAKSWWGTWSQGERA